MDAFLQSSSDPEVNAVKKSAAFHWNAGAWFGSQLGGSCFLLFGAVFLHKADNKTAMIWLIGFIAVQMIGCLLWHQRECRSAYTSLQILLVLQFCVSIIAMVVADLNGQLAKLAAAGGGNGNLRSAYLALLVFPSLMLRFHFQELAARKASTAAREANPQLQNSDLDQ